MDAHIDTYLIERFRAMNTEVEVIAGEAGDGRIRREEAADWFAFTEATFSRFRENSELSRLNRSAGRPFFASSTMMEVLQLAEQYRAETDGVFEPYVLPALEQAGYDVSFEHLRHASAAAPASMDDTAAPAPDRINAPARPSLHPSMGIVHMPAGARLDLGGIVKGWAVDRLARSLRHGGGHHAGLINAGGDLSAWGGTPDSPWIVEVADTRHVEGAPLAELRLLTGAAATSSVIGRRWQTAQGERHHLVDPQTMRPSDSDTLQCTVTGPSAVACDIYAKTICILGTGRAIGWWQRQASEYQALLVTRSGHTYFFGSQRQWDEAWSGPRPDRVAISPSRHSDKEASP